MNRRNFALSGMGALAGASNLAAKQISPVTPDHNEKADPIHGNTPTGAPQQVAMIIYPQMTALDLIGPQTFLAALGNIDVHLVWKDRNTITTDNGLQLIATKTFAEPPKNLDVLFIGGGTRGTLALMKDAEVLEFLADRGSRARYVTSVCTGSLVLGAAGLLRGYKATSHWAVRDVLPTLGAELAPGRIVQDRNRITAGGVTAGIDFGLRLAAQLRSDQYAEMLQLAFEYDPQPPFHAGSPATAPAEVTAHMRSRYAPLLKNMQSTAESLKQQWGA